LTGRGRYVDDLAPPSLAHAVVVRSPHAASILSMNTEAALAAPSVLTALNGRDYLTDGLGAISHAAGLMGAPDVKVQLAAVGPIATVHYPLPQALVGEPAALIVAETIDQAKNAAELTEIT
jgi:carbon-monoxide dehydrogenase large subunit